MIPLYILNEITEESIAECELALHSLLTPPKSAMQVTPPPGVTWGMLDTLPDFHWRYENAGMSSVSEEAGVFLEKFYYEVKAMTIA